MTRDYDRVLMQRMLDHSRLIVELLARHDQSEGPDDRMVELALSRLLTMIGSAAERVSDSTREQYPDIFWQTAVETKYYLIKHYDEVDLELVMSISSNRAPVLIDRLEGVLRDEDSQQQGD